MELASHEQMLLEAVRCALQDESVSWSTQIPEERWSDLLELASIHKVLPMVYEAVCHCKAASYSEVVAQYRRPVIAQVMVQAIKSEASLDLYDYLSNQGLHPLIVKGAVCRQLFPKPDHRLSGDEDLYVPQNEFEAVCEALKNYGMTASDEEIGATHEISWVKKDSPMHIELHQYLFVPKADAYGNLQQFFDGCFDRSTCYQVTQTHRIESLNPHDHMLYLLLHAYKHFIHSGFGIRQVCDIGMWASHYSQQIDWNKLHTQCTNANALYFSASIFQIVQKHLGISLALPEMWDSIKIDCEPMLQDLISAGIYGSASANRLHSATVTLSEVEAQRHNKSAGLKSTLFPKREVMAHKYPILHRHPYLLPAAWCARIVKYGAQTIGSRGEKSAAESMRIAKERTKLLRYYKIIH